MGNLILSHSMFYAAMKATFYLVAGTHRVQSLNEVEAARSRCSGHEDGLRHRILELEGDVQSLE